MSRMDENSKHSLHVQTCHSGRIRLACKLRKFAAAWKQDKLKAFGIVCPLVCQIPATNDLSCTFVAGALAQNLICVFLCFVDLTLHDNAGVFLNNLENHKTENKYRNALIVKVIVGSV